MIIIGMGRVGRGLRELADLNGSAVLGISRDNGWEQIEPMGSGPILVCVNAGDLDLVIERVPEPRRPDLVFIQNGMLDTFLDECGCGENTRGLLFFAVPSLNCPVQPGGPSIFTGSHSEAVVHWFRAIGLEAQVVDRLDFSNEMASKLIWNCTFGLLCDVHDESVDRVVSMHMDDVARLVAELVSISNAAIGTTLHETDTVAQLCAYSKSIAGYSGTLKQWRWRNGWFVEMAKRLHHTGTAHRDLLLGRERRLAPSSTGSTASI